MVKAALLRAIANLDEASAFALYNALAAHIENEDEHIALLKGSSLPGDAEEGEKAERNLEGIKTVVDACEVALYGEMAELRA